MSKIIFVTGGAGFIGSALIRFLINETDNIVVNIDKLTYAGNLESLIDIQKSSRYFFEKKDIVCKLDMMNLMTYYQPDYIMHLAAESHVDRSISSPVDFIHTNILGTFSLLDASLEYYNSLKGDKRDNFRFHHISTDEVFGDLGETGMFTEESCYQPSSPYSASKASSDHLVRAWYRTYGLPSIITNCSNNYGPYHFPEKLIPLVILNALEGQALPVYGNGEQIRDWLYVDDHVRALYKVVTKGSIGETYNIGGFNEIKNIDVVKSICSYLNMIILDKPNGITDFSDLIDFVDDRPGHDVRYAIDASKINQVLGWSPQESFNTGIKKTIHWYIDNLEWCRRVQDGSYKS